MSEKKESLTASSDDSLAQRKAEFRTLAEEWHRETGAISSPSRIVSHPAYLQVISMGEAAIPFILEDLQRQGGDWYAALRIIAKTSPIPADARGFVPRMTAAWLQWGRENGYIS